MKKIFFLSLILACLLSLFDLTQAYARCSYYLSVPFLKQVPPGDWTNTKNCGQTCAVMLGGYFNKTAVNSTQITAQNTWLAKYTGNSKYNDPNGWYTSGSNLSAYQALLAQVHRLNSPIKYGKTIDDILNYGCQGYPVIVGVQISGGKLVSKGGLAHWALLVGFDGCNVILNDPGTSYGNGIRYSTSTFTASWATQGMIYIPINKKTAVKMTTRVDTSVSISVLENNTNNADASQAILAVSEAANGNVVISGDHVDYTPNDSFIGTDTFTYTTSDDNNDITIATVTVNVTEINCDQDGDGQFTNNDMLLFWKICEGSTEPECDLNGDEKFNYKDVKLFKEECAE